MSEDKKITVKEFKMWLEGVEEMQPEGWLPDARQWSRIREKINSIEETVAQQQAPQQSFALPPVPQQPIQRQTPAIQAGPSMMPPPAAAHTARPGNLAGPFANPDSPQMPVRTPNIDTQGKPYESSFA